jgi:hypothetical protein
LGFRTFGFRFIRVFGVRGLELRGQGFGSRAIGVSGLGFGVREV